ncbi:MAG: ABC transporter permease [Gemmatimonadales bacterium]|nr:ABC transporter permease [Gemmatimonadales bacterium]
MNKIFAVIRREFIERVRTKAFILATLGLPLLMVFAMVVPAMMMKGTDRTTRVAVIDATSDGTGAAIVAALQKPTFKDGTRPKYAIEHVQRGGDVTPARDSLLLRTSREVAEPLDGVLILPENTLAAGQVDYFGTNVSSFETMGELRRAISSVVVGTRLERAGVDAGVVAAATRPAELTTIKVSDGKPTGESGEASFLLAYVMGFLLYISVVLFGQQTMMSVIEEKTSRIMEILASSLRPFQMLLGKVLGVGAVGLLQMGIWVGTVYMVGQNRTVLAGLLKVPVETMQAMPIPSIPTDLLIVFLTYFGLGFLLFGALFAAVGSMVNSTQEAQQAISGVIMVIMVGFFGVFAVIKDPSGGLGLTLSMIPFTAPFVMPVRWSMSSVPLPQLALSLVIMVAALLGVVWVAGRIYRTGILMYGKKPTLREVFRWVRAG